MNLSAHEKLAAHIKQWYPCDGNIGLHEPSFSSREIMSVSSVVRSGMVSTAGSEVSQVEYEIAKISQFEDCAALSSGSAAIQLGLIALGAAPGDLIITQALSFIATANAITHAGCSPFFVDVDPQSLSICPDLLEEFLKSETIPASTRLGRKHKYTGRHISGILPVHIHGFPPLLDELYAVAENYGLFVLEDAAEAFGSTYIPKSDSLKSKRALVYSFNGNKTITAGAGGAFVGLPQFVNKVRHFSSNCKVNGLFGETSYDFVGYNLRMSNLNAGLLLGQLETLEKVLLSKQMLFQAYRRVTEESGLDMLVGISDRGSVNFWLNAIYLDNPEDRSVAYEFYNQVGICVRPMFSLITDSDAYKQSLQFGMLNNSKVVSDSCLSLPSGLRGLIFFMQASEAVSIHE